jgi:hypothetical protein
MKISRDITNMRGLHTQNAQRSGGLRDSETASTSADLRDSVTASTVIKRKSRKCKK